MHWKIFASPPPPVISNDPPLMTRSWTCRNRSWCIFYVWELHTEVLQWNEQFYDVLDYFKWQRNKTGDKWPEDCENHLDWPCKCNFLMSVELLLFTERVFDILTWSPNFWLGIKIYHYRHNFDSQGLSKVNRTFSTVANQIIVASYYS